MKRLCRHDSVLTASSVRAVCTSGRWEWYLGRRGYRLHVILLPFLRIIINIAQQITVQQFKPVVPYVLVYSTQSKTFPLPFPQDLNLWIQKNPRDKIKLNLVYTTSKNVLRKSYMTLYTIHKLCTKRMYKIIYQHKHACTRILKLFIIRPTTAQY